MMWWMNHKNKKLTLYELAKQFGNDDAQAGFPLLVNYLFRDFWTSYKYNGIPYSKEYAYNIAYFTIYNFLNREMCSDKPEVFRTKLLREIVNMNLDADFFNILNGLKDATVDLSRKLNTVDINTNVKSATTTASSEVTNESNSSSSGSSNSTNTNTIDTKDVTDVTSSSEETTSNNSNSTNNTKEDNKQRTVGTDYPQSTVDTTVVGNWNYASGATDVLSDNSENVTNTAESESTGSNSSESKSTDTRTGTVKDDASSTNQVTSESSASANSSGTSKMDENSDDTRNIDTTETWSAMSGVDLNSIQLDMFNKYGSFYKTLLTRFENCFISVYIDDDRDGYLDPSINLMSAWDQT